MNLFVLLCTDVKQLKQSKMNKFFMLNFIESSFKTNEVLKDIKSLESYKGWGVQSTEQLGDRGLLLKVKNLSFDGYIFITVSFSGVFVVRTVNKCGMVLMVNKTGSISDLVHIVKF